MKRKYISTYTEKDVSDSMDIMIKSVKVIQGFSALIGLIALYKFFKMQSPKVIFWNFVNDTGIKLLYLYGFLLFLGL